jgi:beta-galactosidase
MKCIAILLTPILLCLLFQFPLNAQIQQHKFVLGDKAFILDGKPFQMISGEMHYPRIPHECWRARIKAAKAMGLNTIATYVFWNLHEPQKGRFNFTGNNNIAEFVKIAQQEGLWVVLRPSPYVCAEWEFGGYPYWLQNENGMIVRSTEANYINAYHAYIKEVGRQLAGLQVNHGGNILLVQIENEYGFYGKDKEYLEINRKMFVEAGFDGLLYTCDPPSGITNGHLPGLLPAVNGLDKPQEVKKLVDANHNGKGPYYIAEWYPAWFDWWGEKHHTVPFQDYAPHLDSVLAAGISINMYMFHGGTTRAFMTGANYNDQSAYAPQISSYDYDAPLDEAGNATVKFREFRKVIMKYLPSGITLPEVPAKRPAIAIPTINLSKVVAVFDMLPSPINNQKPLTFEDLNQDYGYVLYRTEVSNGQSGWLKIKDLRDYGIVFINGTRVGIMDRRLNQDSLYLDLPNGKIVLDIFVENMGRINFGPYLLENKKGITEKVELNHHELLGWQMFELPFGTTDELSINEKIGSTNGPVVRKGIFNLQNIGDTYLDMRQWGKGCVWINGHHLGRYWEIGPQQTLFVPAEWLLKGTNEIVVLELLKPLQTTIQSLDNPLLNVLK